MATPAPRNLGDGATIAVPAAVRFPVELEPPPNFVPADPGSWPEVCGRLEWVGGRLLYMPPCGEGHGVGVIDVAGVLWTWCRAHPTEFICAAGEPGPLLGGDIRAPDVLVFRRADIGRPRTGFSEVAPVLVVEVAGRFRDEAMLRTKARWYFAHGVTVVWLVLPPARSSS